MLLSVPLIAGSEYKWDTFPSGDVELYTTCKVDTGDEEVYCNSLVYCNITELIAPDGSYTLTNTSMTKKTNGYFNYTESLTTIGDYVLKTTCTNTSLVTREIKKIRVVDDLIQDLIGNISVTCDNVSVSGEDIWSYVLGSNKTANVTLTEIYDDVEGIPYIAVILALIAASGIMIFFSVRQETGQIPLKILFFMGGMMFMLIGLNFVRVISGDLGASAEIVKLINTGYIVFMWITLISAIFYIIYVIAQYMHEKKESEEMEEMF